MNKINLYRAVCLFAVAVTFTFASVSAKEPADDVDTNGKVKRPITAAEATIPECLEKLSLSQMQQTEIKEIVRKYDARMESVWKQFGDRYMTTIRTEVALLAAIEDNLTEAQRSQVRDQRRKMANSEKSMEGTNDKPNQGKVKPASTVKGEIEAAGVVLNDEQEAAADKIHQKYQSQLRSLHRDIQGMHTRMVSLEADKLVEIEKTLTKEQLVQLREGRLAVPVGAKVTSNTKLPTKTE